MMSHSDLLSPSFGEPPALMNPDNSEADRRSKSSQEICIMIDSDLSSRPPPRQWYRGRFGRPLLCRREVARGIPKYRSARHHGQTRGEVVEKILLDGLKCRLHKNARMGARQNASGLASMCS